MKKISIFAIMLVCFLALTGCSSNSSDGSGSNNSKDDSTISDLEISKGETIYHYVTVDKKTLLTEEERADIPENAWYAPGKIEIEFTEKDGYVTKLRYTSIDKIQNLLFLNKENAEKAIKENKDNLYKDEEEGYKLSTLLDNEDNIYSIYEYDISKTNKDLSYEVGIPLDCFESTENPVKIVSDKLKESLKDYTQWDGYVLEQTK